MVVFKQLQIKLVSSNEPLLGCGPLPNWLRKKWCIYVVYGNNERNDNLCVWQCLVTCSDVSKNREKDRTTKEALILARKQYKNDKLKR